MLSRIHNLIHRFALLSGAIVASGLLLPAHAQLPVYDSFDYTSGELLTAENPSWILNGTGNDTRIFPGNLEVIGLEEPIGNSITNGGSGAAVRIPIGAAVTEGTIYYSFAMRIRDVGTAFTSTTSFIASFVDLSANSQQCRLAIMPATDGYQLGVTKVTASQSVFDPRIFTEEETLFIVGSYTFDSESTTDDQALLWINPDPHSFESDSPPAPALTANLTGTDTAEIDHFAFRQNTAGNTPAEIQFDELRIGTTWASVTPAGIIPPPPLVITAIETADENQIRLTLETQAPLREHRVQEVSDLGSLLWTNVSAVFSEPNGTTLQASFPAPSGNRFYRALNLPLPPLFSDDFESDTHVWTHGGTGDSWEKGTPVPLFSFTEGALLQDFVFSRDETNNGGVDVLIQGLAPAVEYAVTLWSFDSGSTGTRMSDWSANGVSVLSGYTFDGAVAPLTDEDYRFTFNSTANGSGEILIQGRRNSGSVGTTGSPAFGVFLNALRIAPAATPESPVLSIDINDRSEDVPANTQTGFESFVIASEESDTAIQTNPTVRTYGGFTVTLSDPIGYDDRKRGTPIDDIPLTAYSGTNAWATGLDSPYELNTSQWLRSPVIDLTSADYARLEFREIRDVEPLFAGNPVDYTSVRIKLASDPDGAPLVTLATNVGTQMNWTLRSFVLPEEVLGKQVIIEFLLVSDDVQPDPQAGWLIDDVVIYKEWLLNKSGSSWSSK